MSDEFWEDILLVRRCGNLIECWRFGRMVLLAVVMLLFREDFDVRR
jgi:hypothetical protein